MEVVISQGLFVHSREMHAELLTVQYYRAATGRQLGVATGPTQRGRAVPCIHGHRGKVSRQLPAGHRCADIADIHLQPGQCATGMQQPDQFVARGGQCTSTGQQLAEGFQRNVLDPQFNRFTPKIQL